MKTMNEFRAPLRKPAAALLAVYALLVVAGIYPYLQLPHSIQAFQLLQIGLDLLVVYGLFGYATRRPIRNAPLRLLYLVLVLILCVRVAVAAYFMLPNIYPWFGAREQFVSLVGLCVLPIGLLTAYVLWRYATTVQRTATSTAANVA